MVHHRDNVKLTISLSANRAKRVIPTFATLPFPFSRDRSAILEAAQTYCCYIGVLALGVLCVLRIYVAEGKY